MAITNICAFMCSLERLRLKPSVDAVKAVSGSAQLAGQCLVSAILALIFFIFLARLITKAEMGIYAALMLSYGFFYMVGTLGLNVAAAHFVPKFLAQGRQESASGTAKTIIFVGLLSSIILCLAYFLLAPFLSFALTKTNAYTDLFRTGSMAVLAFAFSMVMDGLMQGMREFGKLALIRLLAQVARIIVSLILLLMGYGLVSVIIGWVVFGACVSFMSFPFLLKSISLHERFYPFRPIWSYSSPILGSNLLTFASGQVDIFLLMLYALPAEVGGYNVAMMSASLLLTLILMSVYSTLLPTMSRAYGKGGIDSVERAFKRASRYVALTYFPICMGLASLSAPTVWLMAGKVYWESIIPLAILALSSPVYGMGMVIIIAITSIGMTRRVFEINAISILGGVISLVLLIPVLGMTGAAIGRSLLFVLMLGYGVYSAKKSMKVLFDSQALWKASLSSALMALLLVALQAYHVSVLLLPFYVLVGISTYALSLKALNAVDSYDLMILKRVLPKKLEFAVRLVERIYA